MKTSFFSGPVALAALGFLSAVLAQDAQDEQPPMSFIPDIEKNIAEAEEQLNVDFSEVEKRSTDSAKRAGPPILDLLFTRHQATVDGDNYVFKNIPYAEAPVGELRFRWPLPRLTIDRTIDDGSNSRVCPQGPFGAWSGAAVPLLFQAIAQCENNSGNLPPPPPPPSGTESEDCLLLDIVVPKAVWNNKKNKKVGMLVWIHGGGYVLGSKDGVDPDKILEHGEDHGGMIFISINYRLGLFGFPPQRPNMHKVTTNAALYDQRLALEWIKVFSSLWGGDRNKVTVIGESAGGGSIMAQLSAFGGPDGSVPFRGAIAQSPAMKPAVDEGRYAQLYDLFRQTGGVDYDAARQMTTAQVSAINVGMLQQSNFSDTLFGPNVDGFFVPKLPVKLMTEKKVDHTVSVIVSHNSNEGVLFTDPSVQTDAQFRQFFANFLPNRSQAKINQIATQVYPNDLSGAQPYTTQTERLELAISEALFLCPAVGINRAYNNQPRNYLFDVCPGLHAQDVSYTFWNGQQVDVFGLYVDEPSANTMQGWFADFTTVGTGPGSSVAQMPQYGTAGKTTHLPGKNVINDPANSPRCNFWLQQLDA